MSTQTKTATIASLTTQTDLGKDAYQEIAEELTTLLADVFTLFVKTKNFHWHVSGPHFRDYHLLLDDQAAQIFTMIDAVAERARKIGGTTLRSIGHIGKLQRLKDNDEGFVAPVAMLNELRTDNQQLVRVMRQLHDLCDDGKDVATASLLENWIDDTEQRIWFLFEATRQV
jgi:starvation-inducible DNA-binding protein